MKKSELKKHPYITGPKHIQSLFDDDYTLPYFYYHQFNCLFLSYPFYCIEKEIKLDEVHLGNVKEIMHILHSREDISEGEMFRIAVHKLLRRIAYKGREFTRNSCETGGKLFSGGFKI